GSTATRAGLCPGGRRRLGCGPTVAAVVGFLVEVRRGALGTCGGEHDERGEPRKESRTNVNHGRSLDDLSRDWPVRLQRSVSHTTPANQSAATAIAALAVDRCCRHFQVAATSLSAAICTARLVPNATRANSNAAALSLSCAKRR